MVFDTKAVTTGVEILASNDFQAVPLKIDEENTVVKAGMPITQAGKKAADGAEAIGILLYDVDTSKNPNAAIVVDGIIDWSKVKTYNTDVTAEAQDIANKLPNITFRTVADDGKTFVFTSAGA